jgi:6-phosphofructokinase 2
MELVRPRIVTLTPNPAIDIATSVPTVAPLQKLRCAAPRRDPGGGGINVARVVQRLGGDVIAIYPAGGSTGQLLRRLVDREKIQSVVVETAEETREDFTVTEERSGQQYRFVLPGAPLRESEWKECLNAVARVEGASFLVASGSLPPNVPEDFYARVGGVAKRKGSKLVLDTSGTALAAALGEGVYLVKPNLRELQEVANMPLSGPDDWVEASRRLVTSGRVEVVVLSLGHRGALLITAEATFRAHAPYVHVVSAVGAGDSFLAAMVWQLACGAGLLEAFRYGVAAGSAAVLNPGTELCHAVDVTRLYKEIQIESVAPQRLISAA